jgi:hypothetical protein
MADVTEIGADDQYLVVRSRKLCRYLTLGIAYRS